MFVSTSKTFFQTQRFLMKSKLFLPLLMVLVAVATLSYDTPKGWQKGSRGSYFVGTVPGAGKSGKTCATIRSLYPSTYCENGYTSGSGRHHGRKCHSCGDSGYTYGDLHQNIDAGNYRGKRVRLTGFMRTENVSQMAGLWMQVGGSNYADRHSTQYAHDYCSMPCENADNMENRAMVGTEDWTRCEIVVDVPEGASNISYGARMYGQGQVWFENLRIEVVSRNVKTTGLPVGHNWKPTNLNFQAR